MIGSQDVILALVIGLVLVGSMKLPELARGLEAGSCRALVSEDVSSRR